MKIFGRQQTPEELYRYYQKVSKRREAWMKFSHDIQGLGWENWFDGRTVYLLMRNEYGEVYTLEVPAKEDYLTLICEVISISKEHFEDIEEGLEEEFMVDSENSIGIRDKFVELIFRLNEKMSK